MDTNTSEFAQYYEDFEISDRCKREEAVLTFWEEHAIFEKSLQKEAPRGDFVFYDGPPTANGRPGIHHVEARAFKDIIPRFRTMQGYRVRRKAGWDTHGLPVELQVEKELGLNSKKEVEAYGIAEFNKKCKENVWRFQSEWEQFTKRTGYWIDMSDPYITYAPSYIESLWHVVKKVHEQGLLYKDYKVVPWCPRCGTALSSHELAQGYKDVKDLSIVAKFKVVGQENTYLLAWTTTPWTLPGNVALAVGKDISYSIIVFEGARYILAQDRVESIFKDKQYTLEKNIKGEDLLGLLYEPLYPYLKDQFPKDQSDVLDKSFKVYGADFVTTTDGTGIVHTAVMYGQDDFELGTQLGLPKHHLVDVTGNFVSGTGFLEGRFVKDEEVAIDVIKDLAGRGLLFDKFKYEHSYPHCWRCSTPLIYYARDSWYIRMSQLRDELVTENESIHWEPDHVREGRFGEWLRGIKDWAISRERYWGTPLPLWESEDGERVVIGSYDELRAYTKKSGNKYFTMRHGEGENNIAEVFTKELHHNAHLTEKGREQVQASIHNFKEKIDIVIASPFVRTRETVSLVCESLGINLDSVIFDERLGEWEVSSMFDGKPRKEMLTQYHEKYRYEPLSTVGDGESFADLVRRVGDFIYDIDARYAGKNIFIVAHDGVVRALDFVNQGMTFDDLKKVAPLASLHNAEIKKYDFVRIPHNENFELDPHKPYIDQLEIEKDGKKFTRVKEVMDVWFDSGAMPFAQDHYPFENREWVESAGYPADYIAEGMDQTRGWFYTLHAVGILMGRGKAYKNVVIMGLINDEHGQKMSKSKGNVVSPWHMMSKYGADPIRLWMYYITQPGDTKSFSEATVQELVRKVFTMVDNIENIYALYKDTVDTLSVDPYESSSVLDQWMIASTQKLATTIAHHWEKYEIMEPARLVRDFILDMSQWYIRRSRDRFKSEEGGDDRIYALATTRFVLKNLALVMAPMTPFIAEELWAKMRREDEPLSVHLASWPELAEVSNAEILLSSMQETRDIVSQALEKRADAGIKVRQPLTSLTILSQLSQEYRDIIAEEVNVKKVLISPADGVVRDIVELDTRITPELQKEGLFREFVRDIQDLRKEKNLKPSDSIILHIQTDEFGWNIIHTFESELKSITGTQECIMYGEKASTSFDRESTFENFSYAVVCEQIVGE